MLDDPTSNRVFFYPLLCSSHHVNINANASSPIVFSHDLDRLKESMLVVDVIGVEDWKGFTMDFNLMLLSKCVNPFNEMANFLGMSQCRLSISCCYLNVSTLLMKW